MTPAARIAAAITILDSYVAGQPAEQALTNWARASRYAGSKDRAAVRDHVYDALRCRRSFGARGGSDTGRGLMIGMLLDAKQDPAAIFTGLAYGPGELTPDEIKLMSDSDLDSNLDVNVKLDVPQWLAPVLRDDLGVHYETVMELLRHRAPLFLRVNRLLSTRDQAVAALAQDQIVVVPHPLADTALQVLENPRRVRMSTAYAQGLVEIQDAASQHIIQALPLAAGDNVLDYCAGGGGKSLALAARGVASVTAHDAQVSRMADLPTRAKRAGAHIDICTQTSALKPSGFDLVLCDVPCSGSGAWRRTPDAKWSLTADRLRTLNETQSEILKMASDLVAPKGRLAYATCSILSCENGDRVNLFLAENPGWQLEQSCQLTPADGGDGFFASVLTRV